MKFDTQKEFPMIPPGEHILKLISVTDVEFDDQFGKSDTGKVTRTKWRFVSNESDDDGTPYDYVIYTGKAYGNEKAALTLLVDMIAPGMTEAKFESFDSDDYIGKKFRAQIKHVKKENGKLKPVHVFLTPMEMKKPSPITLKPVPADDDTADPFADDSDYQNAA